ncbi:MAG: hypothetical protein G5700_04845, partial [Serratia symbiotica]|nr:hypothetical protein [Serratia symbiotica]
LSLRDYDGQVAEALAMICALNKMTLDGMPERYPFRGLFIPNPIYSTKPCLHYAYAAYLPILSLCRWAITP